MTTADNKVTKRLAVNLDKCTGCGSCMYACSSARMGFFSPAHSRVRVLKLELPGVDAPVVCQQCEKPRCVEVCLPKALTKRIEDGVVILDQSKCIVCGLCTLACPYGAIFPTPGDRNERVMLKCDLCSGNPNCVYWCDTGALSYVEGDESERLKVSAENMLLFRQRFRIENTVRPGAAK